MLWASCGPATSLWTGGGVYAGQRRLRIPLPAYPFERSRYYIERAKTAPAASDSLTEKRQDVADWFYLPSWKRIPAVATQPEDDGVTLVFAGTSAAAPSVAGGLRAMSRVIELRNGPIMRNIGEDIWEVNPEQEADYRAFVEELQGGDLWPGRVVVMPGGEGIERSLEHALFLVKALG